MSAIDFKKEHRREYLFRDTRTAGEKFNTALKDPMVGVSAIAGAAALSFVMPSFADLLGLSSLALYAYSNRLLKNKSLPLRLPKSSGLIDPEELDPATGKPQPAEGIVYLGIDMQSKEEVWATDTQARTHMLFMGTTGSGKPHPDDTPVLTPEGWRRIDMLKAGDVVCTPAGLNAQVVSVHAQGYQSTFTIEVRTTEGVQLRTRSCSEHIWAVRVTDPNTQEVQELNTDTEDLRARIRDGWLVELPVCDVKEALLDEAGVAYTLRSPDDTSATRSQLGATRPVWAPVTGIHKGMKRSSRCIKVNSHDSLYIVKGSDEFFKDAHGHLTQKGIVTHNTEFLLSVVYNGLLHCSGFIYVDGKGDAKTYRSVYSMVRAVGRDDDILCVNFQTGAKDIIGAQSSKMSNTLNLFAAGSSGMLSQSVMGLMASGKSDMWSERANSLVEALIKPLVFLRDHYHFGLDVASVRNFFLLERLEALALTYQYQYPGLEKTLEGLIAYLENVPGWTRDSAKVLTWAKDRYAAAAKEEFEAQEKMSYANAIGPSRSQAMREAAKAKLDSIALSMFRSADYEAAMMRGLVMSDGSPIKGQEPDTMLQHGYITMQLVRTFNSMADTYGYIMRTQQAEVDLLDVFLNRRILMVLLPALEKSPAELANLGKIIVATLKATMAIGLGGQIEGETKRIIDSRPTNAPSPFMCVLDEYGYYAVEGFSVIPAQARSLGFSAIFAGQDLPAFEKSSKEEAKSTLANTNSKFCGKLECTDTYEYFAKLAGEGRFSTINAFDKEGSTMLGGAKFYDPRSTSIEKLSRVSQDDLRSHGSGKWHFFFGTTIIHLRSFFANPKPVALLRTNHFLKIRRPSPTEMDINNRATDKFQTAVGRARDLNSVEKKILAAEDYNKDGLKSLIPSDLAAAAGSLQNNAFSSFPDILHALQVTNVMAAKAAGIPVGKFMPKRPGKSSIEGKSEADHEEDTAKFWLPHVESVSYSPEVMPRIEAGSGLPALMASLGMAYALRKYKDEGPTIRAAVPEDQDVPREDPEVAEDAEDAIPEMGTITAEVHGMLQDCLATLETLLPDAEDEPQHLDALEEEDALNTLAAQSTEVLGEKTSLSAPDWRAAISHARVRPVAQQILKIVAQFEADGEEALLPAEMLKLAMTLRATLAELQAPQPASSAAAADTATLSAPPDNAELARATEEAQDAREHGDVQRLAQIADQPGLSSQAAPNRKLTQQEAVTQMAQMLNQSATDKAARLGSLDTLGKLHATQQAYPPKSLRDTPLTVTPEGVESKMQALQALLEQQGYRD